MHPKVTSPQKSDTNGGAFFEAMREIFPLQLRFPDFSGGGATAFSRRDRGRRGVKTQADFALLSSLRRILPEQKASAGCGNPEHSAARAFFPLSRQGLPVLSVPAAKTGFTGPEYAPAPEASPPFFVRFPAFLTKSAKSKRRPRGKTATRA